MKELNLKQNKKMLEIDETTNILEYLKEDEEMFSQQVNIVTYYLDDNANHWTEKPIFSLVSWYDNYKIVNHDNDIEVFNDIYNCLTKNNLIEGV